MTGRIGSRLAAVALVATLLVPALATGAAASATTNAAGDAGTAPPAEALRVALRADGSARVTLTLTYDLESDDERAAFRSLANDSDAKAVARERFARRMERVASTTENATGREMSVTNPAVSLSTAGDVGVVELSVTWKGLAAVNGDRLVLTEPFASGYQPEDKQVVVTVPDGYIVATATPKPDAASDGRRVWATGTDLQGFRLVARPAGAGTATPATSGGGGTGLPVPGFGVVAAVAALAAATLLLRR